MKQKPEHYNIDGDTTSSNLDERLEAICANGIALLKEHDLVSESPKLRCTEFGDAMARYYIQFDSMKTIMQLPHKAKVSEILSAVVQANEFRDVRFKPGEKPVYKDLNKHSSIKFPLQVNLDLTAHKVTLIIQAVLGAVDLPTEDPKHVHEFNMARAIIFQHATRLIRCIVDCKLYLDDAVATRNALTLARSLGAQVWDDSPLHMKQLEKIGLVFVRKLVNAGINSIEELENADAHRIEQACIRNPPFGSDVQNRAKGFPKLRISLKAIGDPTIRKGEHVTVKIKAEIGFLNEHVPEVFQRRPVYVCVLAETSDGNKVHFARISAKKLSKGQEIFFSANLVEPKQYVRAYVMCDEVAGTMRHATLYPQIPEAAFPPRKEDNTYSTETRAAAIAPNTAKRRAAAASTTTEVSHYDEFADPDLGDDDLFNAEMSGFVDIDTFAEVVSGQPGRKKRRVENTSAVSVDWEPRQLSNGKWACNHSCKDKSTCKHLCCRDGVDKKPKPPKPRDSKKDAARPGVDPKQKQLNMAVSTSVTPASPAPGSTESARSNQHSKLHTGCRFIESKEFRDLNRLYHSVTSNTPQIPKLASASVASSSRLCPRNDGPQRLSFAEVARAAENDSASDYGTNDWDSNDLPDIDDFVGARTIPTMCPPRDFDDDIEFDFNSTDFDYLDAATPVPTHEGAHSNKLVDLTGREQAGNDFDLHQLPYVKEQQRPSMEHNVDNAAQRGQKEEIFVGSSTDPLAGGPRDKSNALGTYRQDQDAAQADIIEEAHDTPHGSDTLEWFRGTFGDELFNLVE